ncbi:MAG: lipopolysaccharide biosynthesis protein [Haliscomenobacter sp.]|nr:lipopolysaccharide biosynthesis protein [Haliscomenobacter sp.]
MVKQFNIPSLKKRFFWKVMMSGMGGGLSFISLPLISRSLGPVDYGLFNFLRFTFEKLIQFFDLGASAFYPNFSKNPGDRSILRFLVLYDSILLVISVLLLFLLIISGRAEDFLTTKSSTVIAFTFSFVWLFILNAKITEFMDSLGRTIVNEVSQFTMRIILTITLGVLFFTHKLNLHSYLVTQNLIFLVLFIFLLFLGKKYIPIESGSRTLKAAAIDYRNYSTPLVLASLIGIITGLGDRWILQIFGGAAQQGYYSLGLNLGTISFLLTGSITPLLIREYAVAHANHDINRLGTLFSKFLPIFYTLTAIISCFLATHGDWISVILGGSDFKKAALPVMLMSLAPIHQTYGQLSGGLMIATGRTRVYGRINILITLIGLPITYLAIAPVKYFGLELGATGLALKMVLVQILTVNAQIWYNTRYLGIGMLKFIVQQVCIVSVLLITGFTCKSGISSVLEPNLISLIISGVVYITIITVILYLFPQSLSMSRDEIGTYMHGKVPFLAKIFYPKEARI